MRHRRKREIGTSPIDSAVIDEEYVAPVVNESDVRLGDHWS